jgi:RNA polymerase sigma factor (sigma-70 family)
VTSTETERELLLRYRPWLRAVAASMAAAQPDRAEELAQEAWVAIWQAIRARPDQTHTVSSPLLKTVALNKMRNIIRDWHAQARDISRTDLHGRPGVDTHSNERSTEVGIWDRLCVDLGGIELAYHHGEIREALDALPPKQQLYVLLKYWGGYTDVEMVPHFGYRPKTLGGIALKKLAKELAHLGVP